MDTEDELENLRDDISKITRDIIRLCGERFSLARKIGEIKAQRRLPIEDLGAEENLKREILEECRTSRVDKEFGLKLLNLLLDESKRIQRNVTERGKTDK